MEFIAKLGDTALCPACTGNIPHVTSTIISSKAHVFISGIPVATLGDKLLCNDGSIANISSANCKILVKGNPVAMSLSNTNHGGLLQVKPSKIFIK